MMAYFIFLNLVSFMNNFWFPQCLLLSLISLSAAANFPDCNVNYTCGNIIATYPFTGGSRPVHCGPPQFFLTCLDSKTTIFTFNSLSYIVKSISQTNQTITLARSDLSSTSCPKKFLNTTLDDYLLKPISHENLTLFYSCNFTLNYKPKNLFTCKVDGSKNEGAFYLVGPIPFDPVLWEIATCPVIVTVPLDGVAAGMLLGNESSLGEALKMGFDVKYTDPYGKLCRECVKFGGSCGFDTNAKKPICICDDQACNVSSMRRKKPLKQVTIGLFVGGAVVICLIFGFAIFACRKRRNRSVPRSIDIGATKTEDVPFANLTNSLTDTNSSISFYNGTVSFPSSQYVSERSSSYFGAKVFNCVELEEATDNFDPSREIGDGGFGAVFYGKLRDGREVAVKRLYENNYRRVGQFMNEVEILTRLSHINLVKLYGCTSRRSRELLLVYEYIPNGTVADHLHGSLDVLSWPNRLSIALETAEALAYLHRSDIIHRDVKTTNILLDNDFCVKVADFGLSRLFPTDVTHVSTAPQGTPGYVDPEYHQCYQLTEKSDVYSFGVVLVELISSKTAVDISRDRHDINLANMAVNKIQNGELHDLVDTSLGFDTDSSVEKMITSVAEIAFLCLQNERDMRPTMGEVLEALKRIKKENRNASKEEVADVIKDDCSSPISPNSVIMQRWISTSTTASTSN